MEKNENQGYTPKGTSNNDFEKHAVLNRPVV